MGGHPYKYVVPYEQDIASALAKLRGDVFRRGDYLGGDQGFKTPEEALQMAMEEGTRSILDITKIADEPAYMTASSLDEEELQHYFATTTPTVEQIEGCDELWDEIDRGMARYVVAFDGDAPTQIVFLGYSYD